MKREKLIKIIISILVVFILTIIASYLIFEFTNKELAKMYTSKEYYFAYNVIQGKTKGLFNNSSIENQEEKFFNIIAEHVLDNEFAEDSWDLPDFKEWSCAEIAYALNNIGQSYRIVFEDDPEKQHNSIVKQEPNQGTTVSLSDEIVLFANGYYGSYTEFTKTVLSEPILIECGEWIYYTSGNSIMRARIDLSEKEIVYTCEEESFISCIQVKRGEIYFVESKHNDSILKKIDINNNCIVIDNSLGNGKILSITGDIMACYTFGEANILLYNINTYEKNSINTLYSEDVYLTSLEYIVYMLGNDGIVYGLGNEYKDIIEFNTFDISNIYEENQLKNYKGLYIQEFPNQEMSKLFDTKGKIIDVDVMNNYWYTINKHILPYYYSILKYNKETKEEEKIYSGFSTKMKNANIMEWNDLLVVTDCSRNIILYNVNSSDTYNIKIKNGNLNPYFNEAFLCGNYIYFKKLTLLSCQRYNLLTGQIEDFDYPG